jgi:hypothetical protein
VSAIDAFRLSPKQWEEANRRIEMALDATEKVEDGQDRAAMMIVELQKGLSDVEIIALASGVVIGRMSR